MRGASSPVAKVGVVVADNEVVATATAAATSHLVSLVVVVGQRY